MVNNQENLKGAKRPNPFSESEKPSIPGKESYPKRFKRESWRERIGKFFPPPSRKGEKMFKRKEKAKPKPPPKQEDTSIFRGRPYLKRPELREELRKASPFIPGSGGRMFHREERAKMEKELFPRRKYGAYIDKKEGEKVIKDLRKTKWKAKTGAEKLKIDRTIRFLKGLLKKK